MSRSIGKRNNMLGVDGRHFFFLFRISTTTIRIETMNRSAVNC